MGLLSNLVKSFFVMSLTSGVLVAGPLDSYKTLFVNHKTMASLRMGPQLSFNSKQGMNLYLNDIGGFYTDDEGYSSIQEGGIEYSYITSVDRLEYALKTNRAHRKASNPEKKEFIDEVRLMIIDSFDKKKGQELSAIIDVVFSEKEPIGIKLLNSKEELIGSFVTEEESSDIINSKQITLKNGDETLAVIDFRPTHFNYKKNYTVSVKSDKVTMTQLLLLTNVVDMISGDSILHAKGGKKKAIKAFAESAPLQLTLFGDLVVKRSGY